MKRMRGRGGRKGARGNLETNQGSWQRREVWGEGRRRSRERGRREEERKRRGRRRRR